MNELAAYLEKLELEQPEVISRTLRALDEIRIEVARECWRDIEEFFADPPGQAGSEKTDRAGTQGR